MKRLMILNGPNLNLLGVREPHIYGTTTLAQIRENCEQHAGRLGLALSFHQSNHEGELVDWIQSARQDADAIIINPAGYSFTSVAILDALKAFEGPILEVHISNIHARDEHHRHSKLSHAATAVICGLGPYGYIAAMHALVEMAKSYLAVIASQRVAMTFQLSSPGLTGRPSIPETSAIEPRSHGVLDTRRRGYDDRLWSDTVPRRPHIVIIRESG